MSHNTTENVSTSDMVSTVINESSRTALECALHCNCSAKKNSQIFKSAVIRSKRSYCLHYGIGDYPANILLLVGALSAESKCVSLNNVMSQFNAS